VKEAKKTKIGYKVVKSVDGLFCSYTSMIEWVGQYACNEYILGKISKPNPGAGPLCVFRTIGQARDFCDGSFGVAILKVRYVPSKQTAVWDGVSRHVSLSDLPEGTVLADSVTPIKRMVV
jgi:hypothetical protein